MQAYSLYCTVQAEKRAPGVAAIMYVDRGTDEETFKKGGAQAVNSVVYRGICVCFIVFPSVD